MHDSCLSQFKKRSPIIVHHHIRLQTQYSITSNSKHCTSSHQTPNTVHHHNRLQTQYIITSDSKHSTALNQTPNIVLHYIRLQTQCIITSDSKHSTSSHQTPNTVQHYIRLQTHTNTKKRRVLLRQKFVATKMVLVAAPANDRRQAV